LHLFASSLPRPPPPTLLPYTTLFRSALIMAGSGETLTYRELEDNSVRLARHLHEAGLRRGDHLALLSGNDPKVYEVYWAALRSGDRKSTRLNSSHVKISYAVFCLKKK